MKIKILLLLLLCLFASQAHGLGEVTRTAAPMPVDMDADAFYASVTNAADYKTTQGFIPINSGSNNMLQDIEVGLIDSIPFSFLITSVVIAEEQTLKSGKKFWQLSLPKFDDYKSAFIIAGISFGGAATIINVCFYYNYSGIKTDKKEQQQGSTQ